MKARVWKVDAESVRNNLKAWAERLFAARRDVKAVVLFGSLARGDYTASSDADLLIVVESSPLDFKERIPFFKPPWLGVPVDVFPYTEEECARSLADGWGIARSAFSEGVLLAGEPEVLVKIRQRGCSNL